MSEAARHAPLDAGQILRVIARRRWLLIIPWTLAAVAGGLAAFLLPPVYFSQVTMLLERPTKLAGPLGGMVGGGSGAEQQAEVMREQVQSSLFLRSVITASGIKNENATRAWAMERAPRLEGMSEDEAIESFLIDHLRRSITIRRQRGDIFQIVVGDVRRDRAQRLAEGVANQFVISSKAAQLEAVRATQEFSVEQQQIYKRRLEQSEARLDAARRASIASTLAGSVVSSGNVLRARALVDQAGLEIEENRMRVGTLRAAWSGKARENDAAVLDGPEIRRMVAQLVGLERQYASALLTEAGSSADPGGGVRSTIARKLIELEGALFQTAALQLPSLPQEVRETLVRHRVASADLEAKQARRAFLENQVSVFESQAVAAPDRDMAIARLQQEVDNDRALYNSFLQQSAASQISEAFENAKVSGRFTILEPANLPRQPGKPNRPMLLLLSLLAGCVIGVGTVLLVEQHDQSMKNPDEVESLLGLPVLGAVPRVEELQRSSRRRNAARAPGIPPPRDGGLLHRLKVESPLGLEFRRIYLNLARSRGRVLPRTMAVTSATRGEGKTTTTACLAITLARELHEKLLLVDFDLRSPAMHRALGLPGSSWGLAQMLNQRSFDERFVRSTVLPNLDFLPAGRSERPASELVDSDGVEWFMHEAAARYPMVLVDSAPNLAVPDALILGRSVEGVLYVIKAGSTVRKAAEYGVRVQREAQENVIGVLLNDVGEILPQYYGYRSSYGYTDEAAGGDP